MSSSASERGSAKRTAGECVAALARRYRAPEYALFEQVGNGTGFVANRWADAMAMSLWPSRGLDLIGFEVKVHRNDWLRELRNPSKAEDIASGCDFWFVVAGDADTVRQEELPAPWGLLVLESRGLVQRKPAERRTPQPPLDRPMVAAILRRASEGMVPKSSIQAQLDSQFEAGREQGKRLASSDETHARRELEGLRESVREFERVSGVKLSAWSGGHVGRLFNIARTLEHVAIEPRLQNLERDLRDLLRGVVSARAQMTSDAGTTEPAADNSN